MLHLNHKFSAAEFSGGIGFFPNSEMSRKIDGGNKRKIRAGIPIPVLHLNHKFSAAAGEKVKKCCTVQYNRKMRHSALSEILEMKSRGEKIAMLTAYDATCARLADENGVDAILVGDSLGMIVQGAADTLSVRVSETAYHIRCVRAGAPDAVILGDMPFGAFQESPSRAFANAAKLMAAGATMIKIEGGALFAETAEFLTARGVPVCAHAGLMPQWARLQGGYKVQGRREDAARITADARAMCEAGACMIVLELIPAKLAATISGELPIPTIGIGSGAACDGQVLVMHDMLGITGGGRRFVKNFMNGGGAAAAIKNYVRAVKNGDFPAPEHSFN